MLLASRASCRYTLINLSPMLLRRLKYRSTVWVALLTLVLVTVLPTAAQALVVVQGNTDWLEVCSVSGMVWVHADTGEVRNQQPDGSTTTGEANPSCPWCTLHGGAADLPVGGIVVDLPPRLTDLPPAFYRAPLSATVWAPAQSRAPPFLL
jgi:hypothetical protein